jgi:hypothetical protein
MRFPLSAFYGRWKLGEPSSHKIYTQIVVLPVPHENFKKFLQDQCLEDHITGRTPQPPTHRSVHEGDECLVTGQDSWKSPQRSKG